MKSHLRPNNNNNNSQFIWIRDTLKIGSYRQMGMVEALKRKVFPIFWHLLLVERAAIESREQ